MDPIIIVAIVASSLITGGIVFVLIKLFSGKQKDNSQDLENQLNKMFPSLLKELANYSKEQLESEKKEIKTDLSNKKNMIEDLVKRVLQEIDTNNKKIEEAERERIGSFRAIKTEMENQKKLTEQLSTTTEGLKKVLSNNQLRGQFGEQVAEDLLKMSGFVKGTDYEFNKAQSSHDTRPDFAIFLPDGTRINVDSKFPYSNLQKMTETEDKATRTELQKAFERDIKEKIKQVTTRDYINPEDKTVDFVILFIPNEMIFSFIYDKMNDVWNDAMKQKVILAGPFSFTAILRMVRQAYDNFKYQKNAQKIITLIKSFEKEFEKYNEEFEKIGQRIDSLQKQYTQVSTTRTNQLVRTVDKINQIEEGDDNKTIDSTEKPSLPMGI